MTVAGRAPTGRPRARHPAEVAVVLGTRSEAVALAPVVRVLRRCEQFSPTVVSTGQQRGVLDQVLRPLGVRPDVDLALGRTGAEGDASSRRLTADVVERLGELLAARRPHAVLIHGDSVTAFGAALAAGSEGIGIGHLGAGVRAPRPATAAPPPGEVNQRLIAPLARWHLAPTPSAARNLLAEGVDPRAVTVVGATAIDALLWAASLHRGASAFARDRAPAGRVLACLQLGETDRDRSAVRACALALLASDGLDVVLPIPPDGVPQAIRSDLERAGVRLSPPLDYLDFVATMRDASVVVTDSAAVEEAAPALGTPVLAVRDATDGVDGIASGIAWSAPDRPDELVAACRRLVTAPRTGADDAAPWLASPGPSGDGHAAERVLDVLTRSLNGVPGGHRIPARRAWISRMLA
jgi:UDP-N-acetylglucosamine 2-epimerase (non-hydrolysing)